MHETIRWETKAITGQMGGFIVTSAESGPALRRVVLDCIQRVDFDRALSELSRRVSARRLLRPLLSLIRTPDEETKHRAVTALGWVTVQLAQTDLEAARDVVRRLALTLTEESGGIGWGSPEAIGEILARHEGLAGEYADILISYSCEGGENYLEHEPLQRGVLWALGRLAQTRPQLLRRKGAIDCLRPHLTSSDASTRALAAWAAGLLGATPDSCPEWGRILEDTAAVRVYLNRALIECRVQDLARRATHTPDVPA